MLLKCHEKEIKQILVTNHNNFIVIFLYLYLLAVYENTSLYKSAN